MFPSPLFWNREGAYRVVIQLHLVPIVRRHFVCVGHQVETALHVGLTFIVENILDTYRAYEFVERIEENVAVRKVFPRCPVVVMPCFCIAERCSLQVESYWLVAC